MANILTHDIIGWKYCHSTVNNDDNLYNGYIVQLKIPAGAKTNISRNIGIYGNHDYAKYRCNVAIVIGPIYNITESKTIQKGNSPINISNQLKYSENKTIEVEDFTENIEQICGKGIHFFLSKKGAICYWLAKANGTFRFYKYNISVETLLYINPHKKPFKYPILPIIAGDNGNMYGFYHFNVSTGFLDIIEYKYHNTTAIYNISYKHEGESVVVCFTPVDNNSDKSFIKVFTGIEILEHIIPALNINNKLT
jgi:hypothetical protein